MTSRRSCSSPSRPAASCAASADRGGRAPPPGQASRRHVRLVICSIETGIAHGGSLVYYASICQLIGRGEVHGIDIDIRAHNREAIEAHPMAHRIRMIQGSSTDPGVVDEVRAAAQGKRVLVVLDFNHSHAHVLAELEACAPLVAVGSCCVVFDTVVEDLPAGLYPNRPWDVGDNPKTAVREYLATHTHFTADEDVDAKTLITVAPGGYLRRVR